MKKLSVFGLILLMALSLWMLLNETQVIWSSDPPGEGDPSEYVIHWLGTEDTNWNNENNWEEWQIPDSDCTIIIPIACTYYPSTYTGNPICKSLTINNGAAMTLTDGYDLTVLKYIKVCGSLTVSDSECEIHCYGDWVNEGTFNHGNGCVYFDGGTHSHIYGTATTVFYSVSVYKTDATRYLYPDIGFNVEENLSVIKGGFSLFFCDPTINITGSLEFTSNNANNAKLVMDEGDKINCGRLIFNKGIAEISGGDIHIKEDDGMVFACADTGSSFQPTGGTVFFEGGGTVDYSNATGTIFNHLVITNSTTVRPYSISLFSNRLEINGNLEINNGSSLDMTPGANAWRESIIIKGDWINNGTFNPGNSNDGVITFTGTAYSDILGSSTITFTHFVIQKENSAAIYASNNVNIQKKLTLESGELSVSGNKSVSVIEGPLDVKANSILNIQQAGILKLGNNVQAIIEPNATFKAIGTSKTNRPKVTGINTEDRYNFVISGTINAYCYQFDHLDSNGLILDNNAVIQNMTGGKFTDPLDNNTLITYRTRGSGAPDKIYGIEFSGSPTNCYNTAVLDSGTAQIELEDASGDLSGASHENDPYNLVDWSLNGAPTVTETNPTNNQTNVSTQSNIIIKFSKPLDPDTVNTTNILIKESATGKVVSGVLTYDYENNQAIFNPNGQLKLDTWYTVDVTNGIKDWVENSLNPESHIQFQTTQHINADNSPYELTQNEAYGNITIDSDGELKAIGMPTLTVDNLVLDGKITGDITIKANAFTISETGIIDVKGTSDELRTEGSGSGGFGGNGGSHGGKGGRGQNNTSAITDPYGDIKYCYGENGQRGQDGSAWLDPGGLGGGSSVTVQVGMTFTLNGTIDVRGNPGGPDAYGRSAGGGGAGGSAFIWCDTFIGTTGSILADGGAGGTATSYNGGGGGGGRVAIHTEKDSFTGTVSVNGGSNGGSGSQNGEKGTIHRKKPQPPTHYIPIGGEPVELSRGEFTEDVTDLTIPGRGFPFRFTRAYRSKAESDSPIGYNWDFNYNARIISATDYTDYINGLGANERYYRNSTGGFIAAPGCYNIMEYSSVTDTYTVTERDGTKYKFGHKGTEYKLIEIKDRNNNTLVLSYEGSNRLTGITDTLSRYITFTYTAGNKIDYFFDWTGRRVDFTYDGNGDLWRVTSPTTTEYPQGKTTIYTYSTGQSEARLNHNLLTITDPKGNQYLTNYYDNVDRCYQQTYGTGTFVITYTAQAKVTQQDRNGNIVDYELGLTGNVITETKHTRNIRPGDPLTYVTINTNTKETERTKTIFPKGNSVEYTRDTTNSDRRAQGNLLQITRRTAQGAQLTTLLTYESHYQQVKTSTDARGKVTTFYYDWEEIRDNEDYNGDGQLGPDHGNVVKIVYPTVTVGLAAGSGNQTSEAKFWYNDYGQLIRSIDPLGYVDTYEYYSSGPSTGYLYAIHRDINDKNITNTFEYDNVGNITGIYDGKNHKTTFTVNELNQVTQVTSRAPFSYQVKFDYDANDNLYHLQVQNIDKDGNPGTPNWFTTTFGYDILDNLTSKTEDVSASETITTGFTYDNNENQELITLPETNQVKNFYDERDFLFEVKRGYGSTDESTTTFNYDINGNRTEVKNGRGKTTIYAFDGFDRCTQITDALGNYAVIQYDANSNVTRVTRKNISNATLSDTIYLYDEMNRNYEIQQWLDTTSSWVSTKKEFDKNSRVVTVRDANNHDTKAYYDGLGRVYKTEDHLGNHVDYILDANSNVITRTEYEKTITGTFVTFVTYNVYDNLDRLIQSTNPINVTRQAFYDSRSNATYTIDGENNATTNVFDGLNRLLSITRHMQPSGQIITQYQWDKNSRLKFLIDDKNNTTGFTYDDLNRRKKEIYPDTRYKEFFYDAEDNLHQMTDPNGNQIDNTFDDINRLTHRAITKGSDVIGVSSEDYGYDGLSRMNSASNDYSTLGVTYDTMSRLLTETQQIGSGSMKSVVSEYDSVGFRNKLTYPGSKVVNRVPDNLNRLYQIKDASNNVIAQYTYVGYRVEERTYFNNTKLAIQYDANRRITNYESRTSASTLIAGFEYHYDKENNKLYEKRTHDNKGESLVYDSIYRATGVKYGVPNLSPSLTYTDYTTYDAKEEFTLDGVGNRETVVSGSTTTNYTTNNLNQYTQISGTNLTYDNNGNLTDDGTNTYAYDYANRLMKVTRKSDSQILAEFKYDALGRRIQKYNNVALTTTNYYLDGARVIEERNSSDTVIKTYTYGNGIDEVLTMETGGQTYYFHDNTLGSIYAVTDQSGVVVERYKYEIYGRCTFLDPSGTPISQSAIGNNILFTGRELDTETGLFYYRARYYSAIQGRFINRDPIADDGLLNLYSYVGNSPLGFVDPSGLGIKQGNAGKGQINPVDPQVDKPKKGLKFKQENYDVWKPFIDEMKAMGVPTEFIERVAGYVNVEFFDDLKGRPSSQYYKGGTIYLYSPTYQDEKTKTLAATGRMSSTIGTFYHELWHAYHDLMDLPRYWNIYREETMGGYLEKLVIGYTQAYKDTMSSTRKPSEIREFAKQWFDLAKTYRGEIHLNPLQIFLNMTGWVSIARYADKPITSEEQEYIRKHLGKFIESPEAIPIEKWIEDKKKKEGKK
jgi:RHS repeat-associated protein